MTTGMDRGSELQALSMFVSQIVIVDLQEPLCFHIK